MTASDLGLIAVPAPGAPSPALAGLDQIAAGRRDIAAQWLSLDADAVRIAHAGPLGEMHKLVLGSGLRDLPPEPADAPVIDTLRARLDADGPPHPGCLLAAMLFLPPHRLPRLVSLAAVPDWLRADLVAYALTPPALFGAPGEADDYAERTTRWIADLHAVLVPRLREEAWRAHALLFMQHANFIPLYFNDRNLRDALRTRAAIMEATLDVLANPVDHVFPPRPARARLRLGVLMADLAPRTETFATLPLYRHLDRSQFEVLLFTMRRTGDATEQFCARHADGFHVLPGNLGGRVQALRAADLDLLFIGGNVAAATSDLTLLCFHRLARIQIAGVCSCATTGMRNADYYLSGILSEPADAQAHYTEHLLTVDGPAHCYDFADAPPPAPSRALSRAALGIADDAVVFASGANFHKIVPELEATWARLLAALPDARLILYPFNLNWSDRYPVEAFKARLGATLAAHAVAPERVLLFPTAPGRGDILERLRLADVYLDSFPFSGATSLLDPLELGLPAVIKDGVSFRTLVGPAFLRTIGLDDWVAPDPDGYVERAVRLARDPALRTATRAQVQAAMSQRPKFIDPRWYAAEVGAILQRIWRERAPR